MTMTEILVIVSFTLMGMLAGCAIALFSTKNNKERKETQK